MKNMVDLYPRTYSKYAAFGKHVLFWLGTNILIVVLVLFVSMSLKWRTSNLEAAVEPLREEMRDKAVWAERVAPLADKIAVSLERQTVANSLMQEPTWSSLFSELASAMGEKVWLTKIEITKLEEAPQEGEEAEPILLAAPRITLSGASTSGAEIINFLHFLSGSQYMADMELKISRMPQISGENVIVEFNISGTVR